MQALCGLQGIFDLFNCKTPVINIYIQIDKQNWDNRNQSIIYYIEIGEQR